MTHAILLLVDQMLVVKTAFAHVYQNIKEIRTLDVDQNVC